MKKINFKIIIISIIILLACVIFVGILLITTTRKQPAYDLGIKTNMNSLRIIAELIWDANDKSYESLCANGALNIDQKNIGLNIVEIDKDIKESNKDKAIICYSRKSSYCIQTLLRHSNENWCVDSNGYAGTEAYCDNINYSCQK